MESASLVLCELKGEVNSNPGILDSYPELPVKIKDINELLPKFLPYGSKIGDFFITKFSKYNILTYVFRIKNYIHRDDLLSISAMIRKKENPEIYKPVLKNIIDFLEENDLLTVTILKNHLNKIFDAINAENDILIEGIRIEISKMFAEAKKEFGKSQINLRGNVF